MTLVSYRPSSILSQFDRNYGQLFSDILGSLPARATTRSESDAWTPAVDIHEEANAYVVQADIPGVDPQNIEVSVDNNILSIRGERTGETVSEDSGVRRVERFQGTFYREFTLPKTVDTDQIQAKGKNGVLTITIPKSEGVKAKRITVN